MELIGEGRMAEVFAVDDETVVKIDRPEFDGVALYEATILREAGGSGLPVPDVMATTVVDDRHGLVMQRLQGPALAEVVRLSESVEPLAEAFVEFHIALHRADPPSAPALVPRLTEEIEAASPTGPGWSCAATQPRPTATSASAISTSIPTTSSSPMKAGK